MVEGGITHSQASYQALMNFLPIAAGGMIGEGGMYDRGGVELRGSKSVGRKYVELGQAMFSSKE